MSVKLLASQLATTQINPLQPVSRHRSSEALIVSEFTRSLQSLFLTAGTRTNMESGMTTPPAGLRSHGRSYDYAASADLQTLITI